MKKSILAILLAALLTASLVSCGTPAETEAVETVSETETAVETDAIEARQAVSDGIPELDFKGEEYRVLSNDSNAWYIVMEELKVKKYRFMYLT